MAAVLTPDVGSPILPTDPVVFDLTDSVETLTNILIAVRHDTGVIELAHDGTSFTPFYASGSTRTVITDGYHYSIVRAGGWADTKVVISAFPFAGSSVELINFSSDFGVLSDPPGEDVALSVTGATAGAFGNASHVATFTVDSKGRLTASGQTAIVLTDNSSSPIAHVGSGGATTTSAANIGDVNAAVAAEAAARTAADTAEATARAGADTTITTNLNNEITARIAGDTNAISVSETFATNAIAAARTVLEADGIATGSVQLVSLAFPATGAVVAFVKTVRDFFYLDRTSTLTADGISVVTALGGTGRWLRMRIADVSWQAQATWFVDTLNVSGTASDENTGIDGTHQLRTLSEYARRTNNTSVLSSISITINGSLQTGDIEAPSRKGAFSSAFIINYFGTKIPLFTGTITAIQNRSGASSQSTQMTIGGMSGTWSNSGPGSTSLAGKIIEGVDGSGNPVRATVDADLGSKTALITPPLGGVSYSQNGNPVFGNGTSVTVYDAPSLGSSWIVTEDNAFYSYLSAAQWHTHRSRGAFFDCTGQWDTYSNYENLFNCVSTRTQVFSGILVIRGGQGIYAVENNAIARVTGHTMVGNPASAGTRGIVVVGTGVFEGGEESGNTQSDVEFFNVPVAVEFRAGAGGRALFIGYCFGGLAVGNTTPFLFDGETREGLLSFAQLPNFGVATGIQMAVSLASIATLSTASIDDQSNNRAIGPAGMTWNTNRNQPIAHLGSGGATTTNAANIGDAQAIAAAAVAAVPSVPLAGHAGFSLLGKATTGSGNAADIPVGTDSVSGRIGSGNVGDVPMTAAGRAMSGAASATAQTALLDVATVGAKGLGPARSGAAGSYLDVTGNYSIPPGTTGGTVSALAGDVTGSGTGTITTTIAHVPFTPLQTALAAASAALDFNGQQLTGIADPSTSQGAATKAYVDARIAGLNWKQSVLVASTTNVVLSTGAQNGSVIDDIALTTGVRFALKNQTTASENGLYTANASGAPTRATDADSGAELVSCAFFVQQGTVNADKAFVCTNDAITLGTTSIAFVPFASVVGALIAANNLSDLVNAATARTNLGLTAIAASGSATDLISGTVSAARLPASGVTAATYGDASHVSTVTVDVLGRITSAVQTAILISASAVIGLAAIATSGSASDLIAGTVNAARLPNTTVTPGTYGDASHSAVVTVDATGRLTAASQSAIAIAAGSVSGLSTVQTGALNGDVTKPAGSGTTTLANVPNNTPMAGSLLATATVAPGTPDAGKAEIYVDSTNKVWSSKDDAGVVSHTVRSKAAVAHNFVTEIKDDGTVSIAQPSYNDLAAGIAQPWATFQFVWDQLSSSFATGQDRWLSSYVPADGGTVDRRFAFYGAGKASTIQSLQVCLNASQTVGTATGLVTFTLQVNGVDTSLSATAVLVHAPGTSVPAVTGNSAALTIPDGSMVGIRMSESAVGGTVSSAEYNAFVTLILR